MKITEQELLKSVKWGSNKLLPVIVQDYISKQVLMMAWTNYDAVLLSLQTGQANYWSRSRKCLWHKGATSGHFQNIKNIFLDCDGDTLLFHVEQIGGISCHTGVPSCFYKEVL